MPQSVLSLMKIQASASAEDQGNGSTFPLRDVSHVPAQTAPSPIPFSDPTRPLSAQLGRCWAQPSALPSQAHSVGATS